MIRTTKAHTKLLPINKVGHQMMMKILSLNTQVIIYEWVLKSYQPNQEGNDPSHETCVLFHISSLKFNTPGISFLKFL